jgi:hypothetical protein
MASQLQASKYVPETRQSHIRVPSPTNRRTDYRTGHKNTVTGQLPQRVPWTGHFEGRWKLARTGHLISKLKEEGRRKKEEERRRQEVIILLPSSFFLLPSSLFLLPSKFLPQFS